MSVVAPEAVRAAPDRVQSIEVTADSDAEPRASAAAGLLGELEADSLEDHGIVLAHGAFLFVAEELLEVDPV